MAEGEEEQPTWGTWEELLLVSAVNRHGSNNWDSVAMEIQNRITSSPHFLLTPHNCKQKYQQLRLRFDFKKHESETETDKNDAIPWLEELRKLRVAELRREVQQYDVSIVSLQSKVKRLREEREKENDEVKPDLDRLRPGEPSAEKPISDEDSDRENQSFNESNSTDPKDENLVTSVDESDKKSEIDKTVTCELDPVTDKPAGEGSCNGSSETIAKDSVSEAFKKSSESIPKTEPGESPELWESVAESKGGEAEGTKESSDVQSSASLSKENRRKKDVAVSSSGEEPETDEVSPAIKRISVKSHPLAKFLEIVKAHKHGYVFERRLESQETTKYKSLIRQHMDLEIVNKRLKEGQYSGCGRKFFRDLLLLINNAIVFYPNNSDEFMGAIELRQMVSKEIGSRVRKPSQSPEAQPQPQPPPPTTIPPPPLQNPEPEPSQSLLAKAKSSIPTIASRKRSTVSYKGPAGVGEKKVEKKEAVVDEKKSLLDRKQQDNRVVNLVEEQMVIKKGKRDRPASGARSSRPAGKKQNNTNSNKHPSSNPNRNPSPSSNPSSSSKGVIAADDISEKEKKGNLNTVAKKRSVANFLDRMKKNTSSNGALLESLKNSGNNSNSGKGSNSDNKKSSGGKGDSRKEEATKHSSSRKQSRDQSSPTKRSVGRPPKRNASSPNTPPVSSKRSRDTVETEAAASKQPRKRAKR